MNKRGNIRKINFEMVRHAETVEYKDDCIAFHKDIRQLPIENDTLRLDMFVLIACKTGRLNIDVNAVPYSLKKIEVLVLHPNDITEHLMLSPDFSGIILCLSPKGILLEFSENEIWNKVFYLRGNRIISISEESLRMFDHYGALLTEKIKSPSSPYHKEIIFALLKAALYELLQNVCDTPSASYIKGMANQQEILFKRFISLLSQQQVKPRAVSWYADKLCVTPKYLSTICKQVSGKTAFRWINEYVLIDIRFWLRNTDKSIKEVAETLNFPSITFFGKYCRTHFGVSPKELRKRFRETTADIS